jgi:hypothetical protein
MEAKGFITIKVVEDNGAHVAGMREDVCMTSDKDAMEKAARDFIRDWPNEVYHKNDMTCPYEAGWQAALDGPAVTALVGAAWKACGELEFNRLYESADNLKNVLAEFEKLREASK